MRVAFQRAAVGAAFFCSGAAALVYQVTWQRILALQSGVGLYSIAMIVAAFLVGLGLGSEVGGRGSLRVDPRGALLAFAALEIGLAVFGSLSASFYYDLLYLRAPWLYAVPWRAAASHFAGLLLPTVLMGMSLPLLTRGMVRDTATASRTIGVLYAVNLAGAACGALLAPWWLLRTYGLRGALLGAALANLIAAATALLARARDSRVELAPASSEPPVRTGHEASHGLALWMILYAASGFCALALEMVWFRIVDVAVKSTAFTFGTVLAVYLFGSAMGTVLGVVLMPRVARPLRAFLLAQCAITGWAAAWAAALGWLPAHGAFVRGLLSLFAEQQSYDQGNAWTTAGVVKAYLVLPLALYFVPTLLMGLSFTALQRAVHDDVERSGRRVGLLQAANIAGCVAGSLLVGLLTLRWWGTTGTLRALAVAGAGFALVGLRTYGRRTVFGPAVALLLVLAVAVPPQARLWSRVHGEPDQELWVDEDATGVVALGSLGGSRWRMWVNGRRHSLLPFGGLHTVLGAAPAIVHPTPREIAVIGLGSGDTAWAAGSRGADTTHVTVFELCAPEPRLLSRVAATLDPPPRLREFLADPRMLLRVADGRNALQRGIAAYDVIEMDALHPSSPYSGNLYSEEFLRICASRLAPGGILCTWSPTPRVLATVQKVFPYVLALSGGQVLLASADPLELAPLVWQARLARPDVQAYLGAVPLESLENALAEARLVRERRWRRTDFNTDLNPRDEFNAADEYR